MEIIFFSFLLSIGVGIIAHSRGRSGVGWAMLSLVITPIGGILFLLLLPAFPNEDTRAVTMRPQPAPAPDFAETKTCPRCAETVKRAAIVCRFCGHEFGDAPSSLSK